MKARANHSAYGIALILLSGGCFSVMALGVRLASESFRPDTLVFFRSLIQVVVLLPWWREYFPRQQNQLVRLRVHFLRGVFGILSMFFIYRAFQLLPLGLVNQLTMSAVLWASLFSWWHLNERISLRQAGFALVTVVGVSLGLVSTDATSKWDWNIQGITSALIAGFFMGLAMTTLRKMRQGLPSREIVFFFGCSGVLLTLPYLIAHPEYPKHAGDVGLLLAIGIAASAGQLLMTAGFRYASTLTGTVSKLSELLFNVGLGALFLGESPPLLFFAGILVVAIGIAGLSQRAPAD